MKLNVTLMFGIRLGHQGTDLIIESKRLFEKGDRGPAQTQDFLGHKGTLPAGKPPDHLHNCKLK